MVYLRITRDGKVATIRLFKKDFSTLSDEKFMKFLGRNFKTFKKFYPDKLVEIVNRVMESERNAHLYTYKMKDDQRLCLACKDDDKNCHMCFFSRDLLVHDIFILRSILGELNLMDSFVRFQKTHNFANIAKNNSLYDYSNHRR